MCKPWAAVLRLLGLVSRVQHNSSVALQGFMYNLVPAGLPQAVYIAVGFTYVPKMCHHAVIHVHVYMHLPTTCTMYMYMYMYKLYMMYMYA